VFYRVQMQNFENEYRDKLLKLVGENPQLTVEELSNYVCEKLDSNFELSDFLMMHHNTILTMDSTEIKKNQKQFVEEINKMFSLISAKMQSRTPKAFGNDLLQSILMSCPMGVCIFNAKFKVIFSNLQFASLFGLSREKIPGMDLAEFFVDGKTCLQITHMVNKEGYILDDAILIHRKDKIDFFWGYLVLEKSVFAGEQAYIMWVHDISESKKSKEDLVHAKHVAEEANASKSTFLANMSHELRTPLNAILGYARLIKMQPNVDEDTQIQSDLRKITNAGNHLLSLVNEILDLSKIEAGKMSLQVEEIEIDDLIAEIVSIIKPLAEKNNNEVEVFCPKGIGYMYHDKLKIRQIMLNLASNACKFCNDGTISIHAHKKFRYGNSWIEFNVIDTGDGISEEFMKKLFDPFTQEDKRKNENINNSSGLGLSITKNLVEIMGGTISVSSIKDEGSTFTVSLPVSYQVGSKDDEVQGATAGWKGKVLLVDDDPTILSVYSELLATAGYKVYTSQSAVKSINIAKDTDPDVIMLDVLMPDMDGWNVLEEIRKTPKLRETPVIMLSIATDRDLACYHGVSDFLAKPIDKDRLIETVGKYVSAQDKDPDVMIVDDYAPYREVLRRNLETIGLNVVEADSGETALKILTSLRPAVIVSDIIMPSMSGLELINSLKSNPSYKDIDVAVITAKGLAEDEKTIVNEKVRRLFYKGNERPDQIAFALSAIVEQIRRKENKTE